MAKEHKRLLPFDDQTLIYLYEIAINQYDGKVGERISRLGQAVGGAVRFFHKSIKLKMGERFKTYQQTLEELEEKNES